MVGQGPSHTHDSRTLLRRSGLSKGKGRSGLVWPRAPGAGGPEQVAEEEDRVVIRSNGQPTYFASDLGYLLSRFEDRGFKRWIEVWAPTTMGTSLG